MKPDTKIRQYKKQPTVNNITVQVDTRWIEKLLIFILFTLFLILFTLLFK